MDEEFHKALSEYAAIFKKDPVAAEAVLEKYKDKFKDFSVGGGGFDQWAGAMRGFIKAMRVRKANPHMHIEDVFERAQDS